MPALPASPFLYPILDPGALAGRDPVHVVGVLAEAGVRIVQLRLKAGTDRARYETASRVRAATRARDMALVVNDRVDLARVVEAEGVHLGQDDLPPEAARAVLGPGRILGLSTHSLDQLRAAAATGPDYVAVGPVFPTRTKDNPDPVVGLDLVRTARAGCGCPLVAIGGISRANARDVVAAGADGLAVIADLFAASDLREAAEEFQHILSGGMSPSTAP